MSENNPGGRMSDDRARVENRERMAQERFETFPKPRELESGPAAYLANTADAASHLPHLIAASLAAGILPSFAGRPLTPAVAVDTYEKVLAELHSRVSRRGE